MTLTTAEAACVYAALILADEKIDITADKLKKLVEAASVDIEPIWTTLFAKALEGKDVTDFLMNIGSAPAAGAAAPAAAAGAAAPAAAAPKKEEKVEEESDEDMGFGLFD